MTGVPINQPFDRDRQIADVTLAELVVQARKKGVVRVKDGEDVFELRFLDDTLTSRARDFLIKSGPVD